MNKQRPRIRPVGALAAAAARKQQPVSTDEPTFDDDVDDTQPLASTATASVAAARLLQPSTSSATAVEGQSHRPAIAAGAPNPTARRGASLIRPGAASAIRPGTAPHTDSFALAFHSIDEGASTALANLSHTAADAAATHLPTLPAPATAGLIVPYQHLGLLDPCWNIPTPSPQEKTLKDFCSKFKVPRQRKQGASAVDAATTKKTRSRRNGNAKSASTTTITTTTTTATTTRDHNAPTEEPVQRATQQRQDPDTIQRSGPIVEVINGEIVIKESSLILGTRRPTTEEVDRELEQVVVEESTGITATYNSFTKRQKTQHWSALDTRRFFSALRQCGTDFSTMETLYNANVELEQVQYRTRKQLKGKYLLECKSHPRLVDMAMNPSVQIPVIDLSVFGELDIGTEVPPLLLPAPITATLSATTTTLPTEDTTTATTTTLTTPFGAYARGDEEMDGRAPRTSDTTRVENSLDPEEQQETVNDRNESEPLQDEFTTTTNSEPLLPLIKHGVASATSNKKRPNFRAALKGKKSSMASTSATATATPFTL